VLHAPILARQAGVLRARAQALTGMGRKSDNSLPAGATGTHQHMAN
jgi:hypothetical protein